MYVYVVRTCIQCGTNVYLGGTKMGGTKRRWYEKTGYRSRSSVEERPPCVREVMGSIPVWDSDIFFVLHLCHVE